MLAAARYLTSDFDRRAVSFIAINSGPAACVRSCRMSIPVGAAIFVYLSDGCAHPPRCALLR